MRCGKRYASCDVRQHLVVRGDEVGSSCRGVRCGGAKHSGPTGGERRRWRNGERSRQGRAPEAEDHGNEQRRGPKAVHCAWFVPEETFFKNKIRLEQNVFKTALLRIVACIGKCTIQKKVRKVVKVYN